MKIRRNRWR